MLDYTKHPCVHCNAFTVINHQYIGDECCETCGNWQQEDQENADPED